VKLPSSEGQVTQAEAADLFRVSVSTIGYAKAILNDETAKADVISGK